MRKLRKALYVASIRSSFGFPSRAVLLSVKGKFSAQPGIFCFTASQRTRDVYPIRVGFCGAS
jgi:hypothetical protein